MKAKLVRNVKKIAAVATGALFVGATLGMASVFASGLSSLPGPFVSNGHVNAVFVVGANAAPTDILGAIDVSAALTAAAAATHSSTVSGQITIGTLSLSSKAHSLNTFETNDTPLNQFAPASINLYAENFTSGKGNYTSVENLTFTKQATFNGLNIEFPAGAYALQSYIVNRNTSVGYKLGTANLVNFTSMANATYEFGKSSESLLGITAKNATFGTTQSFTNVLLPTTPAIKIGLNTVDIIGIATIAGNSTSASVNELEVSVNGKATQYLKFTGVAQTVGPVSINPGTKFITNSSGQYIESLSISSVNYPQNITNSKVLFPNLGAFNMTANPKNGGIFNLNATEGFTLLHSFTSVSGFALPDNLTTVDLEKLVPTFPGKNITISVGSAKSDVVMPNEANVTASGQEKADANLSVGSTLPNIGVGTGELFTSSVAVPSGKYYFGSSSTSGTYLGMPYVVTYNEIGYNVSSSTVHDLDAGVLGSNSGVELAFNQTLEAPSSVLGLFISNATAKNNYTYFVPDITTSAGTTINDLTYTLPGGRILSLGYEFTPFSNGTTAEISNLTSIQEFDAMNTTHPASISFTYNKTNSFKFDGYNVTVTYHRYHLVKTAEASSTYANYWLPTVNITGSSLPFTVDGKSFSAVPGQAGLFASNNSLVKAASNGILGSLSFNGSRFVYTDPVNETLVANIGTYANYSTHFVNDVNSTAPVWGADVSFTKNTAKFAIPTENYTLAIAGSEVVTGQKNYTIGQTVSTGELLNVSGVSSVNAADLLNSNPDLAIVDSSFTGSTNSVPVIVMGGPAINTLADTLLNQTAPVYGAQFTNLTGVGANEALIEMFNSVSAFNNQPALWVAGYSSSGTLEASEVLAESLVGQPVVSLTGNKVILSTASSSYKGVTVVNGSN